MGYEQIDGVKNILVNEKGQIRRGLRTLPLDADRYIYQLDESGNKKNMWPEIVVQVDSSGSQDVRLLPELVLKEHGKLPRQVPCSREDFEAINGEKLPPHCHIDNIKYVGDGSFEAQQPYAGSPEDTKQDGDDAATQESPEGQKVKHTTATESGEDKSGAGLPDELAETTNKQLSDESGEGAADEDVDKPPVSSDGGDEPSDLMKGSGELKAKRAIELIRNFEYEELVDVGFYTEGDRDKGERVTVKDAWESKKKSARG